MLCAYHIDLGFPIGGKRAMVDKTVASPVVANVDVGALLAWIRLGVRLWSGRQFPALKTLQLDVTRMVLALALRRVGTISAASRLLMSSRKVLRDNMHRTDLYPWPPTKGECGDSLPPSHGR